MFPRKGWPPDRGAVAGKGGSHGEGEPLGTRPTLPHPHSGPRPQPAPDQPPEGPRTGLGHVTALIHSTPHPGSVFTLLQGGPYVLLASCDPPLPAPSGTRWDDPCPRVCSAPGPENLVPMLGLASRGHGRVPRAALGRTQDAEPRSEAASPQAGWARHPGRWSPPHDRKGTGPLTHPLSRTLQPPPKPLPRRPLNRFRGPSRKHRGRRALLGSVQVTGCPEPRPRLQLPVPRGATPSCQRSAQPCRELLGGTHTVAGG